jgi:ribosomal protein S18 acetylase RimI-like enzyme
MIKIVSAQAGTALDHVITLSQEYVGWMIAQIREHYPELDIHEFTSEHDYDDIRKKFPGDHIPPNGCLLIALSDDEACGCVALGKLTETICEVRTLYVRPACRGAGVGRKLVEATLDQARKFGYSYARLDTLGFMDSALSLYRSLGFYDIAAYRDISASLKQYICFLELKL